MLGPVQPTPYDLKFSLFGIPVRVMVTFWLGAAVLGWSSLRLGLPYLLTWIVVAFVSILVHEMGHALTARLFGYPPRIMMYHFGGLALFEPHRNFSVGKSVLITLAGPFAGFAFYGLIRLSLPMLVQSGLLGPGGMTPAAFAITQLLFINLWWGVLNLLPVLPLDGGQICRDVCITLSPRRGTTLAIQIGLVAAALVAFYFFQQQRTYAAILFAFLAIQNFQELQQRRYG
ncbi:site-2 protease family protein [Maioricimonas sp. JC845]|uniref:site-2 protease family protein n=1 Tax=Maioricimonas sp. JC845 TaxID=3232138 RepID=UPI00345836B3